MLIENEQPSDQNAAPWQFQSGVDTKRSFQAFKYYLSLPEAERSNEAVAKHLGVSAKQIGNLRLNRKWDERCHSYKVFQAHYEGNKKKKQTAQQQIEDYQRKVALYRQNTETIGSGLTMMGVRLLGIYQHAIAPIEEKIRKGEPLNASEIQVAMKMAQPVGTIGQVGRDGADLVGSALHLEKLMSVLSSETDEPKRKGRRA